METLRSFLVAVLAALLAASTVAAFPSGGDVMERVMLGGNCRGTVAECLSAADEFGFSSEVARRFLATSDYISYGALQADRTPCSITGASYYNCRPGAGANPYTRSCSAITQCRS